MQLIIWLSIVVSVVFCCAQEPQSCKLEDQDKFLERMTKLESLVQRILVSQTSTEDSVIDLKSSLSTLNSDMKQLQDNHRSLVIPSCQTPTVTGIYKLQLPNINVFCEAQAYGGRWLYIQRRTNGEVSFDRNWYAYRTGFGTVGPYSEFWLGLEAIHQITSSGNYELNIAIVNENGQYSYARFSQFKIAGESDGYRLTLDGYSGTAGDNFSIHSGMKFSTYDEDNDKSSNSNCARLFNGGWWFNNCGKCNLNGPYSKASNGKGITWGEWAASAIDVRMMIRRKN